ncbi:MAG: C4-type zinc ribbon domain-containing protein [Actinomycetota bacterium]
MSAAAHEQILAVQAVDVRLRQLRHKIEQHPLRAELAEAEAAVAAEQGKLAEVESRRHEVDRDQKRLSDEVATIEAKRAEIEGKLYDGSVQATKELLALQEESANLLGRQTALEDEQLEGMELLETVSEEESAVEQAMAAATTEATGVADRLATAVAELEAEVAQATTERSEAAGPADPQLLARYEELAPQFDGAPLARLVDGLCDGCNIRLPAMTVDQMQKAATNAVFTCEECGRLLVR